MKKTVEMVYVTLAFLAVIYGLGMIGNVERTEEIIRSMDSDVYYQIADSLRVHGEYPSDEEIADFYLENY